MKRRRNKNRSSEASSSDNSSVHSNLGTVIDTVINSSVTEVVQNFIHERNVESLIKQASALLSGITYNSNCFFYKDTHLYGHKVS
jgi:hypothetical protein